MKKIFASVCLLCLLCNVLSAQITLQPNVPATGLIQKNQLWNVVLINSSNLSYRDCRLNIIMRDRLTGQEMFAASTAAFIITPGLKQLNAGLLNPIQYNYISGSGNNNLQGFIQAGSYIACYSLTGDVLKAYNLSEECIQIDTEPLSPPLLVFPADSSILENSPNQFSWTAPTPLGMFERLQYEIIFSEIREGQNAQEALQLNLPFYNQGSLPGNFLNYPPSFSTFENNKWYAWQVVARDERSYAGKSEVWVFKWAKNKAVNANKESFAQVTNYYTGKKYYFISNLYFSFLNPYASGDLDYSIINTTNNKKLTKLPIIKMAEGLNQVIIESSSIKGLQKNVQYAMEIYNAGAGTQYLNFIIQK